MEGYGSVVNLTTNKPTKYGFRADLTWMEIYLMFVTTISYLQSNIRFCFGMPYFSLASPLGRIMISNMTQIKQEGFLQGILRLMFHSQVYEKKFVKLFYYISKHLINLQSCIIIDSVIDPLHLIV